MAQAGSFGCLNKSAQQQQQQQSVILLLLLPTRSRRFELRRLRHSECVDSRESSSRAICLPLCGKELNSGRHRQTTLREGQKVMRRQCILGKTNKDFQEARTSAGQALTWLSPQAASSRIVSQREGSCRPPRSAPSRVVSQLEGSCKPARSACISSKGR